MLTGNVFAKGENFILYHGDTFPVLALLPESSVDLVFADPPYFLSSGGISCSGGRQVKLDKGAWDRPVPLAEKHEFNRKWIQLCYRVLRPGGCLWVSGTFHNIFSVGMALEEEGFRILNNITWQKANPPPNLTCRCFTHSTETFLWACKTGVKEKYVFHYGLMKEENGGKQMKDVWTGPLTPQREKQFGKHPTQKPEYLLERIIRCSTNEGDVVLDPFCGSGTAGVAALRYHRKFIGIDMEEAYLGIAAKRLAVCLGGA